MQHNALNCELEKHFWKANINGVLWPSSWSEFFAPIIGRPLGSPDSYLDSRKAKWKIKLASRNGYSNAEIALHHEIAWYPQIALHLDTDLYLQTACHPKSISASLEQRLYFPFFHSTFISAILTNLDKFRQTKVLLAFLISLVVANKIWYCYHFTALEKLL